MVDVGSLTGGRDDDEDDMGMGTGGGALRPDAGGSGSADEGSRASMSTGRSRALRWLSSGEGRADGAQSDRGAGDQGIELAASVSVVREVVAHSRGGGGGGYLIQCARGEGLSAENEGDTKRRKERQECTVIVCAQPRRKGGRRR
jgi:hypothetical protein